MKLAVIGLGKLGAPMAAVFAAAGHDVIGVDARKSVVDAINEKRAPVAEKDLQTYLNFRHGSLRATQSTLEAVEQSEAIFIIVPTPSKSDHSFSAKHLTDVAHVIAEAMERDQKYRLIVVTSTTSPGTMGALIMPALGRLGKQCGKDYGLCYSPEFIAIGDVIAGLKEPDFILLGESDSLAGEILENIYRSVCGRAIKVARMNWIEAEIAKLAVNCFVTMKMSFANMIAMLCAKLPGADAAKVLRAVGYDHRIGRHYLTPAAAFGGPCFPRDNRALLATAHAVGASLPLPYATDRINAQVTDYLARQILALAPKCIALLGLTYKPGTYVTEESAAIALSKELSGSTTVPRLIGYDPGLELAPFEPPIPPWIKVVDNMEAAIKDADVVVISTPWEEFGFLNEESFEECTAERIHLFDLWRQLDHIPLGPKVVYHPFGRHVPLEAA